MERRACHTLRWRYALHALTLHAPYAGRQALAGFGVFTHYHAEVISDDIHAGVLRYVRVSKPVKILFVEDDESDAVLVSHELSKGGLRFRLKRVDTREAFVHELEHNPPDVIFSDHGLPAFDGFAALAIARAVYPHVPFIFVTGSMGEQMTIETFEGGASGYVLKGQLSRLVPVMQRALDQFEERAKVEQRSAATGDMRVPLQHISAHAKKLQAETAQGLSKGSKQHVRIIVEQAEKMSRILNVLLDSEETWRT